MLVCILYPSKIVDHFTTAKSSVSVIFFSRFENWNFVVLLICVLENCLPLPIKSLIALYKFRLGFKGCAILKPYQLINWHCVKSGSKLLISLMRVNNISSDGKISMSSMITIMLCFTKTMLFLPLYSKNFCSLNSKQRL